MPVSGKRGFTLIEALTSLAILSVIVVVLVAATRATSDVFRRSNSQVETFQTARAAFQDMLRDISQATLNTRWDYDDPNNPTTYRRSSGLHFVLGANLLPSSIVTTTSSIFFVIPNSWSADPALSRVGGLLSAWGYYVELDDDTALRPANYTGSLRTRYRLMRLSGRTENLQIYNQENPSATDFTWFTSEVNAGRSAPVAENIVALVAWPRLAVSEDPDGNDLSTDYSWNSRLNATDSPQPIQAHQMPPLLDVTMVAIGEQSAERLQRSNALRTTVETALNGLFQGSTESRYRDDVQTLEQRLQSLNPPVDYRIFRDTVVIRENKWSSS